MSKLKNNLWAPSCWYFLHIVAYHSRDARKFDRYIKLFQYLGQIMPCEICVHHYKQRLKNNPITRQTNLVRWIRECHNDVNRLSKKPELNQDEVDKLFYIESDNERKIVINHNYISIMLQIFRKYHSEKRTLNKFFTFLQLFRKCFPCPKCQSLFKEKKNKNYNNILRVLRECKYYRESDLKKQTFSS